MRKSTERFKILKPAEICRECRKYSASCDGFNCASVRQPLRKYNGIRFTADGFDCALPVTIDTHSVCSFGCVYCFSDNLLGHRDNITTMSVGQTELAAIESLMRGRNKNYRLALKMDKRNDGGYPCPIQVGGLCDPFDNIERNQGFVKNLIRLAIKFKQPLRFSTKGNLFLVDEYLEYFKKAPELFWVAFSIITSDDEIIQKVDIGAPTATERLECMRRLADIGVETSLRLRPIICGISELTYDDLIDKAADAGAKAISYETMFVPGARTAKMNRRFDLLENISAVKLRKIYESFGKTMACTRPSYLWTEDIMHRIRDKARQRKLWIGVSDPVWKELGEHGCCCGIPKDHPVFGNWERENATNALLHAKETGDHIYVDDVIPEWSRITREDNLICYPAGPLVQYKRRHKMWSDSIIENWNNIGAERSPMNYFQGALQPVGLDDNNNIIYKFVGLGRKEYESPYWRFTK